MPAPRDWVQRVIAQVCPPAVKLVVAFEGLDGYGWRATPFNADPTSEIIAGVVDQTVTTTLASREPTDALTLLDRLYVSSPVRFELRRGHAADPADLLTDSSELLGRLLRSRAAPGLLLIQTEILSMCLTLHSPSLVCRGRSTHLPLRPQDPGRPECPVCGDDSRIAREVYPGADGCTGCGSVFAGRRR